MHSLPLRAAPARALVCITMLAVVLTALLPSERMILDLFGCTGTNAEASGAAADDRTRAVPAPRAPFRHRTDLIATAGTTVRGGGGVWEGRFDSTELPAICARSMISTRQAVDAIRTGAFLSASETCLASDLQVATAVATTVQFLC